MNLLGFLVVVAATTSGQEGTPIISKPGPVCPLIAERLPMKPPTANRKSWRFDTRAGIKGFFEGTVTSQFGAGPVNQADGKEWQRAATMCERKEKGGECKLEGPVIFFVQFDKIDLAWELEEGEKMLFRVKGTVMECEDLISN